VKGTKKEHNYNPKGPEGGAWVVELRGYTYHEKSWEFVRDSLVYNLRYLNEYALSRDPTKIKKVLPDVDDPVFGKISHVFLAAFNVTKAAQVSKDNPVKLDLIRSGLLDRLIAPSAAATGDSGFAGPGEDGGGGKMAPQAPIGPGGPGGPGAVMGGTGSSWRGLLRGGGEAAGGAGMMGMGGMGSGMMQMFLGPGAGMGEAGPGEGGFAGTGLEMPGAVGRKSQQLCEFIVYFVWREPTPTDALTDAVK
jgi:hypothetical protein